MEDILLFENKIPEERENVMINIKDITEYGINVDIVEYNLDGFISFSELSRFQFKNIKTTKNKNVCVGEVIRVYKEKKYVDISIKRINESEEEELRQQYENNKTIKSILYNYSLETKEDVKEIVNNFYHKLPEDKYDFLKKAAFNTNMLEKYNIDSKKLVLILKKYFKKEEKKYVRKIKIVCYDPEGVEMIKDTLKDTVEYCKNNEINAKIETLAIPFYQITLKDSEEKIEEILNHMKGFIKNGIITY